MTNLKWNQPQSVSLEQARMAINLEAKYKSKVGTNPVKSFAELQRSNKNKYLTLCARQDDELADIVRIMATKWDSDDSISLTIS